MIVEDHSESLDVLCRLLHKSGFTNIVAFSDSVPAIDHFIASPPDLLILDWHLKGCVGNDFLGRIISKNEGRELPPVLVVSADLRAELRIEALSMGASDFLAKPLDPTETVLRIRNLLQTRLLYLCTKEEVQKRTSQLDQSIAQLNDLRKQLIQQERLQALGSMASGIAHDFNNTLTIILGFSGAFQTEEEVLHDPAQSLESFKMIQEAANDAAAMVLRLTEFCRPYNKRNEIRHLVNINQIIEAVVQMTKPKWQAPERPNIKILTHLKAIPLLSATATELREMFTNFIFNAVDAMPDGGEISFYTHARKDHVLIEVQDTGKGMSETTRHQCMEPFYTTKGAKGTGLGLAIIYGIVKRHGGSIRVDSALGKGTCFFISLPTEPSKAGKDPHIEPLFGLSLPAI